MQTMSTLALLALLLTAGTVPAPVSCVLFGEQHDTSWYVLYIANLHSEHACYHPNIGLGFVTIEGSVKLTTAPSPDLGTHKICQSPLVPFGKLTQDRRGINFWYLRLKITQLLPGQFLAVVNTDQSEIRDMTVETDQRIDLTHRSHSYPAILHLKYRYARLYWNSTRDASQANWVNITASTYAKFNESVNATMQKELCERYGNTWCERSQSTVCIGPNSCSLQDDCFDSFTDPSSCSDALWVNGNLTFAGSSLHATGWILRNLPWLALGAVPIVLVVALAKICSQKRDLDIDDDYEYKMSYSDHPEGAAAAAEVRNGGAVRGLGDDGGDDDDDDDDDSSSSDGEEGEAREDGPGPYYSYPNARSPAHNKAASPSPPAAAGRTEAEAALGVEPAQEALIENDDDAPPPPPPRLSQTTAGGGVGDVASRTGASLTGASASGGRALHRLTEVSLEDDDNDAADTTGGGGGNAAEMEDPEEEEFVNVEYLRQQMRQQPADAYELRAPSGEYTTADPGGPSPRSSYTRLLSQPSPDTIEELLRPPACDEDGGGGSGGDGGVVYAQLVLPPPSRTAASPLPASSASASSSSTTMSEALELQAVRAPANGKGGRGTAATPPAKKERESYDMNYIVV